MIKTKRGLDLPISGIPEQTVEDGPVIKQVALLGLDYPGLKPTMEVKEGDLVSAGQLLFTDKKSPGIKFTSPASGTISAINRGDKRVFESIVIDVLDDVPALSFASYPASELALLDRVEVVKNLVDSGQWTALRTRPFSKVPDPDTSPDAIFVTSSDSRPLSAEPSIIINEQPEAYLAGIDVLSRLTDGKVFVCRSAGATLPKSTNPSVQHEEFMGPHPSGNVGTHIHFLYPVHTNRSVWTIGYQDVIAIGSLFTQGQLYFGRVIALGGPATKNPRLLRTRLGASTIELTEDELQVGDNRIVSGSVLDGRRAAGSTAFLGRLHLQISVLEEGTQRDLLDFVMPGLNKFSLTRLFLATFIGKNSFALTTSTGGSPRSIIPLGTYEEVMPMDILPTQLLRALVVGDFDASIALGCLELDEEDLALCTFACPGKYEYGPYLRQMLTRIEVES